MHESERNVVKNVFLASYIAGAEEHPKPIRLTFTKWLGYLSMVVL